MPYDAAYRAGDKSYLIGLIQNRAVVNVTAAGEIRSQVQVGGYPNSLQLLPSGNFLVSGWDASVPGFVREFDVNGNMVWELNDLKWPWKAQRLTNGNTLIADAGKNRVFEVNADKTVVWEVTDLGPSNPTVFDRLGPVYVQRLANGNTLVSIRGLDKVVELDAGGNTVWEIGAEVILRPYSAVRLTTGHTLICDGGHGRVIEVDEQKNIVWEKGGFIYVAKAYRVALDDQ